MSTWALLQPKFYHSISCLFLLFCCLPKQRGTTYIQFNKNLNQSLIHRISLDLIVDWMKVIPTSKLFWLLYFWVGNSYRLKFTNSLFIKQLIHTDLSYYHMPGKFLQGWDNNPQMKDQKVHWKLLNGDISTKPGTSSFNFFSKNWYSWPTKCKKFCSSKKKLSAKVN